jgi:hypothetical protein
MLYVSWMIQEQGGWRCEWNGIGRYTLLKRTLCHTSTAHITWDHVIRWCKTHGWHAHVLAFRAVAAHARHVTVEERVGCWV